MNHRLNMKKLGLMACIFMSLSLPAISAGYQVLLQGNRSTAMGNLGVGLRPDASSMFFNPGAMSLMDHNEIMLGINLISSNIAYWDSQTPNSTYTAVTDNPLGTPFHAYAVWGPDESRLKFALGAYTPFGSGVKWGQEWAGRYLLDEITLQAIYTQATVSYRILDNLSIGAGFVAMFGNVALTRVLPVTSEMEETTITLEGKSKTGLGYNVGVFYSISEKWQIGASYRSKVDAELVDGDVSFTNVPTSLSSLLTSNQFDATLPLPSSTNLGITFIPSGQLTVGVEANYIGWSAYESLSFDFEDENIVISDSESPRNYEDSWVFHLGGEYSLSMLKLRAGAYYDITPVQEGYMTPETPDANRIGLTAGIGYAIGENFGIDVSFLFIRGKEREQSLLAAQNAGTYPTPTSDTYAVEPGTYKLRAYIPGLSLSYKF